MGIAVGSCSLCPELGKAIDLWHDTPYHLLVKFLLALLLIFFKKKKCASLIVLLKSLTVPFASRLQLINT